MGKKEKGERCVHGEGKNHSPCSSPPKKRAAAPPHFRRKKGVRQLFRASKGWARSRWQLAAWPGKKESDSAHEEKKGTRRWPVLVASRPPKKEHRTIFLAKKAVFLLPRSLAAGHVLDREKKEAEGRSLKIIGKKDRGGAGPHFNFHNKLQGGKRKKKKGTETCPFLFTSMRREKGPLLHQENSVHLLLSVEKKSLPPPPEQGEKIVLIFIIKGPSFPS